MAPCSSLILLMLENVIRPCFVASWLGVSGMVFFLDGFVARLFHVGFAEHLDGDGHLFCECTFPPLVEIRENPEFHNLMRMDKGHWPRCLLWHGWLPMLSGVNGTSLWAAGASESASYLVETALGSYSSSMIAEWGPPDDYDRDGVASLVPDQPNVWSDGSLVLDRVTGVSSSGAGCFAHQPVACWDRRRWGHVDQVRPVDDVQSCRGYCSVPGPLQSVQRAGMWGVILALQSSGAVHLGVDNLGVVRHVGRLLDGRHGPTPFELVKDGDLLLLIERMLHLRGLDTVRITKVKGHADESMVLDGRVLEVDRLGNDAADEAGDFGRRRVGNLVIDALGSVVAGALLFLTFIDFSLPSLELWSIMMVGMVLLLILWYGLLVLFPRGVGWFMRFGTRPFCLGRRVFGIRNGLTFLHLLFALRTLLFGPILLVSWSSRFLF